MYTCDSAYYQLEKLLRQYGVEMLDEPDRLFGMVFDLAYHREYERQRVLIQTVLKDGIVNDLKRAYYFPEARGSIIQESVKTLEKKAGVPYHQACETISAFSTGLGMEMPKGRDTATSNTVADSSEKTHIYKEPEVVPPPRRFRWRLVVTIIALAVFLVIFFVIKSCGSSYGKKPIARYYPSGKKALENEDNNNKYDATIVDLDVKYYGSISSDADCDWFVLKLNEKRSIDISFSPELFISNSEYWKLYLYTSDGTTNATNTEFWSVSGDAEITISDIDLSAGTYFFVVRPYSSSTWTSDNYSFKIKGSNAANNTQAVDGNSNAVGAAHTSSGTSPTEMTHSGQYIPNLTDEANLLTEYEKAALSQKLSELSEECKMDIVIVTANSIGSKSPQEYADDFYVYNDFGFAASKDGILLLLVIESRDWHITTCGNAIQVFSDRQIDLLADSFLSFLSDGMYYQGFETFAEKVAERALNY